MQLNSASEFHEIATGTIYLMGGSFILGSLFTLLVLVLLDFMRRQRDKEVDL